MKFKKYLALSLAAAMVVTGVPGVGVLTNPMNVMAAGEDAADAGDTNIGGKAQVSFKDADNEDANIIVYYKSDASTSVDMLGTVTYNGKDQKPSEKNTVVKTNDGEGGDEIALTRNVDYVISYYKAVQNGKNKTVGAKVDKIVDAGDYFVAVTGKGKYSGTIYCDFTVDPLDIATNVGNLSVTPGTVGYTGKEISPVIGGIEYNNAGVNLVLDEKDYTLKFVKGDGSKAETVKAPGQYDLELKAKGNYTGTLNTTTLGNDNNNTDKLYTTILKKLSQGDAYLYYDGTDLVVAGSSGEYKIEPDTTGSADNVTVKIGDATASDGKLTTADISDSTFSATITGDNKTFSGEITASVKFNGNMDALDEKANGGTADGSTGKANLSNGTVSIINNAIYTGDEVKPTVIVKDQQKKVLKSGVDYDVFYDNNVSLGENTGHVTVVGKGDYYGMKKENFTINPNAISSGTVAAIPSTVYTGQGQPVDKKKLTVTDSSGKLISADDISGITYYPVATDRDGDLVADNNGSGKFGYEVEGSLGERVPVDAGTYVVEIALDGKYAGSQNLYQTYTIKPASISNGYKFTAGNNDDKDNFKVDYTGKIVGVNPGDMALTLLDANGEPTTTELLHGRDYIIEVPKDAKEVGSYSGTVKGCKNYTGEIPFTFNVVKTVAEADMTFNVEEKKTSTKTTYIYTPSPLVREGVDKKLLNNGTDYTVDYYAVKKEGVTDDKADYKVGETNYQVLGGKTDTFTSGNEYIAVIKGIGDYEGQIEKVFTVPDVTEATSIADATITFTDNYVATSAYKTEYTGDPVGVGAKGSSNAIAVRIGNKLLTEGTDFEVTYANNKNVSKDAQVIIIGKGDYYGTASAKFEITQKEMTSSKIVTCTGTAEDGVGKYGYSGKALNATITVGDKDLNSELAKDIDYEVSYAKIVPDGNNAKKDASGDYIIGDKIAVEDVKDVGSYLVVINGIGNYSGKVSQLVKVEKLDISAESKDVTIKGNDVLANADGVTPSFSFISKVDASELNIAASNYTVKLYADKGCSEPLSSVTEVGTYYAKLKGQTNAIGTSDAIEFNVVAATSIEDADITVMGDTKDAKVVVTLGDKLLKSGVDYDADIVIKDGIGTVTVTGKGIYTGTATTTFKLPAVALSKAKVSLSSSSYTYDGKTKKPSVTVKIDGKKVASSQYTVKYSSNKNAGTAKVTITAKDSSNVVKGSTSVKFTIKKANQKLTVSPSSKSFKVKNIKAKKATFTVKVKGAKGTVSYKSSSKNVTVTKKGAVTIKKGTKKGTYKITVTSAKTTNYNAAKKTVTIKVK